MNNSTSGWAFLLIVIMGLVLFAGGILVVNYNDVSQELEVKNEVAAQSVSQLSQCEDTRKTEATKLNEIDQKNQALLQENQGLHDAVAAGESRERELKTQLDQKELEMQSAVASKDNEIFRLTVEKKSLEDQLAQLKAEDSQPAKQGSEVEQITTLPTDPQANQVAQENIAPAGSSSLAALYTDPAMGIPLQSLVTMTLICLLTLAWFTIGSVILYSLYRKNKFSFNL